MKAMNTMRLCFDSRSCNEAFARTAVAAFLCGLDPTVEELSDVKTAVSEAVTNCIVHGYRSRIDKVYLTATIGIKPNGKSDGPGEGRFPPGQGDDGDAGKTDCIQGRRR